MRPSIHEIETQNKEWFAEVVGEAMPTGMQEWLYRHNYFIAPAAKEHHSNYPGGLMEHSVQVTKALCELTKKLGLKWQREESPIIVGMMHDLCKTEEYSVILDPDEKYGYRIEYNDKKLLNGHGNVSLILLQQYIAESQEMTLTEEEAMCIVYHMGAFTDQKEWKYYSRAVKAYPNVLYTHTADMIASQIKGI